jgi:hypothetical protein
MNVMAKSTDHGGEAIRTAPPMAPINVFPALPAKRDTTPPVARPEYGVDEAEQDLQQLLQGVPVDSSLPGERLVRFLRSQGHTEPAAHWALHTLLSRGLLAVEPAIEGEAGGGQARYPGGWGNYRNIAVRAADRPPTAGPQAVCERIAADRWSLDQFVTKAREIRRRLLRWHESLPTSIGVDVLQHDGRTVRCVAWHQYPAICHETFRSRLKAGHGEQWFTLIDPHKTTTPGPIEGDGRFSSNQTEYVLRDFWEHLTGDPTLEILRVAFGVVLDSQVFSVQALGVPKGQLIGVDDVKPGVTPWAVTACKIDQQLLNDLVDAAEKLAGPPQAAGVPPKDHSTGVDDPDIPLSPAKLADRLGLLPNDKKAREALRKRLESWRKANLDGGWIGVTDPKPREPRYLYPLGKVWPLIQDMKPSG